MRLTAWRDAAMLAVTMVLTACGDVPRADPSNAKQVASGRAIYDARCASCHGANLEGQADWMSRKPDGRMPAPPHDRSGHTWHHADDVLFGIVRNGMTPPYAPQGYQSDMPAFGTTLSDQQIRDTLAYIKSRWPPRFQEAQREIDRQRTR